MKNINEMSYTELVKEVQGIASILDDQPYHHDALLLDIVSAMVKKAEEVWAE